MVTKRLLWDDDVFKSCWYHAIITMWCVFKSIYDI